MRFDHLFRLIIIPHVILKIRPAITAINVSAHKGVGGGLDGDGEEVVGAPSCEMKFYTIPCINPCTAQLARHHIPIMTPPYQGALVLHDTAATH